MERVLTVTLDRSTNEDIPTMVIATKGLGFFGEMEVINTITGERAIELYNELSRPKKVCVKS